VKLLKQEQKVMANLYSRKMTADRQWGRVFLNTLHRQIDLEVLYAAMDNCNKADQALLDFKNNKKIIKKGEKGLSDEEYQKKYIDPYRQSKI